MKPNRKKVITVLVVFFIALWAMFAYYYYTVLSKDLTAPPSLAYMGDDMHRVRDFSFVNQDGDTVSLKDFKDKILIVDYFFTTCQGICPIMNDNMADVYKAFKNDDEIVILSHTVDPKRDTVEAMRAYAQQYEVDSKRWMFLTGDKQELYDQARFSYFISAIDSSKTDIAADFIHSEAFVIVDKNGRVRAHAAKDGKVFAYDGTDKADVAQLIKDVKLLKAEK